MEMTTVANLRGRGNCAQGQGEAPGSGASSPDAPAPFPRNRQDLATSYQLKPMRKGRSQRQFLEGNKTLASLIVDAGK